MKKLIILLLLLFYSPVYGGLYGQFILQSGNGYIDIWIGQTNSGDVVVLYSDSVMIGYAKLSIIQYTLGRDTVSIATGVLY